MSYLLRNPTTVLAVTPVESDAQRLRELVLDGEASELHGVGSVTAAEDVLDDDSDVGCVLVTDGWSDAVLPDVCARLADVADLIPVVAYVSDGNERLAHETVRAGALDYVPASVAESALRESVDDAIATFAERRDRAADSSILTAMLRSLSVPMYAKDREGRYLRASYMPGEMHPEDAIGKTDLEVHAEHGEDAERSYEDDLRVVEDEAAIHKRDEVYHTPDGEYWSRTTKIPWYDEQGSVQGLVGISHDVTGDVKAREQLAEHQSQFEQFTSHVSHELRGPLQVAAGALDLARETGDPEGFETAERALDRIDDIIEDVTAMAEGGAREHVWPENAQRPKIDEQTNLQDVIEDIWSVVPTEGAVLDVELPSDAWINTARTSVRPIFENLFKNAVVHAGPAVRVRVGLTNDGFYVEDDGPGVPADRRERIFEEGYTTAPEGNGTGLSIVATMADQHRWTVDVTDGSDGGARFEVGNCLVVPEATDHRVAVSTVSLREGDTRHVGSNDGDCAVVIEDGDRWRVRGSGADVWRQTNEFCFVHVPGEDPVRIEGRVSELERLTEFTKGGFMVRGSTEENAAYGYIGATPDHGTEVLWRHETGEHGVSQQLEEGPIAGKWYRLERVGDVVTSYLSTDGENWQVVDRRTVDLGDRPEVGLVVCSHVPGRNCEVEFESVSIERLEAE